MTFLEEESNMGQFYMAIDVNSFVPITMFKEKVDKLIKNVKVSSPAPGFKEILLPGERAFREEEKGLERVPISDEIWQYKGIDG